MAEPFIGEVRIFTYSFAPVGWSFCDGQVIPIIQQETLWNLIGTTYGGDGTDTFALPNLQGRTPIGVGQGPGLSSYTLGEFGGTEAVTLSPNELPSHTHTLRASSGGAGSGVPDGTMALATPASAVYAPAQNLVAMGTVGGPGQPHQNRQPYTVLHYCIALQGIFPSQT